MPDGIPTARHELPEIDGAAFEVARLVDRLVAAVAALDDARGPAADRWLGYFKPFPDQLRDGSVPDVRAVARRIRAAYGPKDSIRDVIAPDLTEPLLDATDRLLKVVARYEAHRQ